MEKCNYILDSFAILAFLKGEEGSDKVEELLRNAENGKIQLFMHAINLGEVFYAVFKQAGETQALNVYSKIRQYPVEFLFNLSESFLLSAASLKGTYPISYADAFAVATTIERSGVLVTGDPEMKRLEKDKKVDILWIQNL
jgi:predicted nucleic acid-binding protein